MAQIGNYRIERQIGEGGFAKTYLGKHVLVGEYSCLKQNLNISKDDTDILRREAAIMWNLHHYSLPAVRDFFEAGDGSHVIAMSYAEGPNIEQLVETKGPIHPEDVSWISQRSFSALHYLHFNGIVHCDMKPPNIILRKKEHNIVLLDYGMSAFRPTGDTKALGYTPAFVAPELAAGNPPIPQSDYYGMGLSMIYMLGGNIVNRTCPASTPDRLAEFIDELVQPDPARRPDPKRIDLVDRLSEIRQEVFGRRHTR
jgi:eukaryotic-like serine/threonine-protein kinase